MRNVGIMPVRQRNHLNRPACDVGSPTIFTSIKNSSDLLRDIHFSAGIELMRMLRKGQLGGGVEQGHTPAERVYSPAA